MLLITPFFFFFSISRLCRHNFGLFSSFTYIFQVPTLKYRRYNTLIVMKIMFTFQWPDNSIITIIANYAGWIINQWLQYLTYCIPIYHSVSNQTYLDLINSSTFAITTNGFRMNLSSATTLFTLNISYLQITNKSGQF